MEQVARVLQQLFEEIVDCDIAKVEAGGSRVAGSS